MDGYCCPECNEQMFWQNDFQEQTAAGEKGRRVVTYYFCSDCEIRLYKHRNLSEELKEKIVEFHKQKAEEMRSYEQKQ